VRILLASLVPDDRSSGMGRWAHQAAEALEAQGHEPTLWFGERFPLASRLGRLAVVALPVALTARLVRERSRFDVVVIHEPGGLWYGLLRRAWRRLPPMVAMCHNVESKVYEALREARRRGLITPLPWTWLATPALRLTQSDATIRLADHVVCLSAEDERYLTSTLRVPAARITRTPNGVAPDAFADRGARPAGHRVLFVGGWLDVKGRRLLPSLWHRVREALPEATLTLVGARAAAGRIAAEFEPGDRSSLTAVPQVRDAAEMREHYRTHDVLLMPSLVEGSPLSLLEAMAAGTPAVAAAVGGVPDIVTDGRDGWLFRPMDPEDGAARLIAALRDRDALARVSGAAVQRARQLTWDAVARALAEAARGAGA
jgi:glycosyltransferase involved in cell wall biosynthesis